MRRIILFACLGALLWAGNPGCAPSEIGGQTSFCDVCRRQVRPAIRYRIHLRDGRVKETCCPRCGLHFEKGRQDVARREVADFETGNLLKAEGAHYVEGSSVHLCCATDSSRDQSGSQYELSWDRCLPSLTAFRSQEAAEQFRRDKGGSLKTFQQLTLQQAR